MLIGAMIILAGAFLSFFDFRGKLVNEDNYEIINETTRGRRKTTPRQDSGVVDMPTQSIAQETQPQAEEIQPASEGDRKRYGSVQGGQQFADKSPKDFIRRG